MPDYLKRYQSTGDMHFVTFSCHDRQPYLVEPEARDTFLASFEAMRRKYGFCVIGYVLMPEHVHLLLTEPKTGLLATALQALKISVASRCPQKPFWLRRYYDFNVFLPEKRIEKLKYIHRNPVRRGLVDGLEEWVWSSFNHDASGLIRPVEIESEWTMARREGLTLPKMWGTPKSEFEAAFD